MSRRSPVAPSVVSSIGSPAWLALGAVAGVVAAAWYLRRASRVAPAVDALIDRWDAEGSEAVDGSAMAS
jgi:hypothetical protein